MRNCLLKSPSPADSRDKSIEDEDEILATGVRSWKRRKLQLVIPVTQNSSKEDACAACARRSMHLVNDSRTSMLLLCT